MCIRIKREPGNGNKLTDDYVGGLAPEFGGYPLEASLLPDLGGGVDVLHGEDGAQPEQENLRQRRNQLNTDCYMFSPLRGSLFQYYNFLHY
jgi:hypothetical protein